MSLGLSGFAESLRVESEVFGFRVWALGLIGLGLVGLGLRASSLLWNSDSKVSSSKLRGLLKGFAM